MTLRSLLNLKTQKIDEVFYITFFYGSVAMLVISLVYTFLELRRPIAIGSGVLGIALALATKLYAKRKKDYFRAYFLLAMANGCITLPLQFVLFGGSISGMPVCFLIGFATAAICLKRKHRLIAIVSILAVDCLMFFLEGLFPGMILIPLEGSIARMDIILAVISVMILFGFFSDKLMNSYNAMVSSQMKALESKTRMYRDMLEREETSNSTLRKLQHDVHHHNHILMELLRAGYLDKAISYLEEYDSMEYSGSGKVFCVNLTLNGILNYMDRVCRKNGIEFSVNADVAENIPVSSNDITVIAANILENAVNGAQESGMEEKKIVFRAAIKGGRLILICENTCGAEVTVFNGTIPSYSTGIQSVQMAIEPYGGTMEYEKTESNRLKCSILLNLEYRMQEGKASGD